MYLAKYGFAVVNANYRLVPQIGFQDQLHDALDAIIWTNEHAHDYGMDTNALFLIGDSAATLLILYLTAVLHSPVVASQLGMRKPTEPPTSLPLQDAAACIASKAACMELRWDTMRKATFQR